ncbi:MAG: amidohydrolase family protein [Pseudomonadales bacterium]|nr:amidohydrolase family protein [Pseudomonadales bacterium]
MAQHDLVIRGGTVIDGTGAPARTADVAIQGRRIVEVGRVAGSARREFDAAGALVAPGFVDIHTHYDGQATWGSRMAPSCHHGVTTAVMGNCGVGFAPVRPADHDLLIELMEGVEDIPGAALHEGLSWDWQSFPQYLDYLDKRRYDIDLAAQLPHAALRVFVMGERGANREPANADDVAAMQKLTAEAIRAGAIGFTSSRTLNHRSSKGAPTPSLKAERDELVAIARGLRDAGRGVLEFISDFEDLDAEFELLRAMVRESGRPMSISLAQGLSPHGWRKVLGRIEAANAEGLVMRGQVAPRPIGILLGLTTTLNPFTTRPSYMEIARLPLAERVLALKDPARRARIAAEETAPGFQRLFRMMDGGRKVWVLGDPPNYEPDPADSIAARAAAAGRDTWEFMLDVLVEEDGRQILFMPFANYAENNLDCCREMLLHANTVPGLGDGGAHVGTICDASFTTTLLTHWGRDRTRGELIDLPTLIRRQTHDTARAVDLTDRGTLEPGMKADVNVIDFANLRIRAPEMVRDLPAGGARLEQKAEGFLANVVSGEITYERGQATDALPGRLVR